MGTMSDAGTADSGHPDTPIQQLAAALGGPTTPAVVALVGGGGKTTTLFALTRHLHERGLRVVATTTTKMGASQTGGLHKVGTTSREVIAGARDHGAVIAVGYVHGHGDRPKVGGLTDDVITSVITSGEVDAIIIEADGSRRHNVKAPAPHEPVIPSSVTHVVAVIGADALDRVIEDQAHRPMRTAAAAGAQPYQRLTAERAARLLMSDIGSRKSVPSTATFAVIITKVAADNEANANEVARLVRTANLPVVLFPFVPPADPTKHG
jgi:molybdenum cofactor cytidylyltransferase